MNISKPTHVKVKYIKIQIILKKTGNIKKNKGIKVGMTICRSQAQEES